MGRLVEREDDDRIAKDEKYYENPLSSGPGYSPQDDTLQLRRGHCYEHR